MINIAICDDENIICTMIEEIVEQYSKNNLIDIDIEVFWNGDDLIEFIEKEHKFDLIFLDIEIGKTTGIDVSQKIRNCFDDHISKIVFISSKNGYENELFDVQPLNFLKKPVNSKGIDKCIELSLKLLENEQTMFKYKVNKEVYNINVKEIIYFEKSLKKIKLVSINEDVIFYDTVENVKCRLPKNFIEPHKSYIVNFNYIKSSNKTTISMINGDKIPISQRGLKQIRDLLFDFEKEKYDEL